MIRCTEIGRLFRSNIDKHCGNIQNGKFNAVYASCIDLGNGSSIVVVVVVPVSLLEVQ